MNHEQTKYMPDRKFLSGMSDELFDALKSKILYFFNIVGIEFHEIPKVGSFTYK